LVITAVGYHHSWLSPQLLCVYSQHCVQCWPVGWYCLLAPASIDL
jgi:hypothetical protein